MDAVDEVKQRLSIEDVISEYVPLKRAGRNWRGLSPFSNEKTPSFMVSPEKQIWHDFSSGKGGNMFSFVMEVEGVDFKGALELLARKAGVDLDQYRSSPRRNGPNKERLHELLELAAKFYQVQFSQNKTALEYVLKKRQFSKETALEWRLGYAPNNGSALVEYAKNKGFNENEIKQAGLSARSYRGGIQDMFRGRLMIPLQDPQGRVIGFTARLLEDIEGAPKYINTPQTVLYDKSRHIYGLHLAKESIRKGGFAVLVEGNLDVIASHQAGVRQVVATAGTALTEPHLKALSRFTGDIRLCFDADKAGVAATERAIPIASRVKVSLSIIDVPSGKDPDELIRQDPELWKAAINKNQYALDWLMARYKKLLDVTSAKGKREFSDVLLPVVRGLSDDVERDHYLNAIAAAIDVSKDALTQKLSKTSGPETTERRRRVKTKPEQLDKAAVENQKTQDQFLALMLSRQTLREFLDLVTPDMLYKDEAKQLLDFLKQNRGFKGAPDEAAGLKPIADYVKIEVLLYEELYQGLELNELHYEAARLQARLIEQFIKNEKRAIANQLETADPAATRTLLTRAKQYDELLNQVKGAAYGQEIR
ncbi:MAG TPA: DNA primase [Candidatus Saccharimonadales bacterium]|nr:DNA primase [Candidatus Saccharimonadales bacterium]